MGGVRPMFIKRAAREFIEKYPDKFTTDFKHNSKALDELMKMDSKRIRNRVAGYITTLLKQKKEV
jgi:small subunit ribosomal protein S17e